MINPLEVLDKRLFKGCPVCLDTVIAALDKSVNPKNANSLANSKINTYSQRAPQRPLIEPS
tara:strand:+ start:2549 stop:2731 length:183 start_codon:yes stop_codon:yes gene_type:complete